MPEQQAPETALLKGIATSIASKYVGGLLTGILGGSGDSGALDEIRTQLQTLTAAVTAFRHTFDDFSRTILAIQDFEHRDDLIHASLNLVEGDFDLLSHLSANDHATANDIKGKGDAYHNAFLDIHGVMSGGSLSGGDLITSAAAMVAARATQAGYDPTNGAVLMENYHRLERYFQGLVITQLKAAVLIANAYDASGQHDLTQIYVGYLPGYVHGYALSFLSGAEALTATFHHDITLLDMLVQHPDADPVRAAQAFVQRYPSAAAPRVWMWVNTAGAFSAALPLPDRFSLGDTPAGIAESGIESPHAVYGIGSENWAVARFAFATAPSGIIFPPANPSANVSIDPAQAPSLRSNRILKMGPGSYSAMTAATSASFTGTGSFKMGNDDTPAIGPDSPFTMECWAMARSTGTVFAHMLHYEKPFRNRMWRLYVDDDFTVKFGRMDPDSLNNDTTGLISSGVPIRDLWHHFAVVADGAGTVAYYVDGQLVGTTPFQTGPTQPLLGGLGEQFALTGSMNEFRLWNRALSGSEITSNLHAMLSSGSGLVAVYGFDRGSVYDRSQQSPPLTMLGNVTWTVSGLPQTPAGGIMPWLEN
jgi:hypothetical protein